MFCYIMGIDLRIMVQMVSSCINSTSTQKIQYNANGLQITIMNLILYCIKIDENCEK